MRNKLFKGFAVILLLTLITFMMSTGCMSSPSQEEIDAAPYKKGDIVTIVNSSVMCNCAVDYYYLGNTNIRLVCEDDIKRMYDINLDTALISKCYVPKPEPIQKPIPIEL